MRLHRRWRRSSDPGRTAIHLRNTARPDRHIPGTSRGRSRRSSGRRRRLGQRSRPDRGPRRPRRCRRHTPRRSCSCRHSSPRRSRRSSRKSCLAFGPSVAYAGIRCPLEIAHRWFMCPIIILDFCAFPLTMGAVPGLAPIRVLMYFAIPPAVLIKSRCASLSFILPPLGFGYDFI